MSKQKVQTPTHIAGLLHPRTQQSSDRRVWSIPLKGVLVPFLTATNAAGETAIPSEVLGCPLRLAREKDGTPKFTSTGRPVVRVAKDISDQVRIMRDNFIHGLMAYTDTVVKGMPDAYKAQVEAAQRAGTPVAQKDADDLDDYLAQMVAQADGDKGDANPPADTPVPPEKVEVAA
jgi:hypothetical protein